MPGVTPPEEIAELMRFVAEEAKDVKYPMSILGLSKEFRWETGSAVSEIGLRCRIVHHRNKIFLMDEFDVNTRVKMMFALRVPVHPGFLSELRKHAEVEVDEEGRIIGYKSNDGSLELDWDHSGSAKTRAVLTDNYSQARKGIPELMKFIAKKSEGVKSPMNIKRICQEFLLKTGSLLSVRGIFYRIHKYRQAIPQMNGFDINTKVRMMFALSASVDSAFLNELKKHADVNVDNNGKIVKYKSNDGSLELEGNHSMSGKKSAAKVNKKKARVVSDIAEEDNGVNDDVGRVTKRKRKSNQSVTSSSTETVNTWNRSGLARGRKRTRIAYYFSEEMKKDPMSTEDGSSVDPKVISHDDHESNNDPSIEQETESIEDLFREYEPEGYSY